MVAMEALALRNIDLVNAFMEFYNDFIQIKRTLARVAILPESDPGLSAAEIPAVPAPVTLDFNAQSNITLDIETMLARLQAILESQAAVFARTGTDHLVMQYREAQYVMAALADDILLYEIDWAGRDIWRENVLEYRLFRTRVAGERIFDNINRILRTRNPRDVELAPIYILALSLGFKGRYRAEPDRFGVTEKYTNDLFELVFGRAPNLNAAGRHLIPAAYQHTIVGTNPYRFGYRLRWSHGLAALIVGFVLVGEILWFSMTGRLSDAADMVIQVATPTASR